LGIYLADGGSDQVAYKRLSKVANQNRLFAIDFESDCLLHIYQLIYKTGLLCIDAWLAHNRYTWKYYGSVAKLFHVWRDLAVRYFKCWVILFGPERAMLCAFANPPMCISGRWGCISRCEARVDTCTALELATVVVRVFSDMAPAPASAAHPPPLANADVAVADAGRGSRT
jgi:hypothetical protein